MIEMGTLSYEVKVKGEYGGLWWDRVSASLRSDCRFRFSRSFLSWHVIWVLLRVLGFDERDLRSTSNEDFLNRSGCVRSLVLHREYTVLPLIWDSDRWVIVNSSHGCLQSLLSDSVLHADCIVLSP